MGDFNETRDGALGEKFCTTLKLFTEQFALLQNAVVAYRTEHQADMRQIRDELLHLRSVVMTGHSSSEAFTALRSTSTEMLNTLQQQHAKDFDRFMILFDRLNLMSTTSAPPVAPPPAAPASVVPPPVAPSPIVALTSVAPTSVAPSSVVRPSVAPSSVTTPSFAPTSFAPTNFAPTSFAAPNVAKPSVTPPSVAPPSVAPPSVAPMAAASPAAAVSTIAPPVAPPPAAPKAGGAMTAIGGASGGTQKPLFGAATTGMTFNSVAQNPATGFSFLNKSGTNASAFNADPKQFSLFGGANKLFSAPSKPMTSTPSDGKPKESTGADAEDESEARDETAPEDFVPDDTMFKRPDVALPSLVDSKTGEEDEEVVFQNRARVYRYMPDTKEVKERGTGELKVLKHKATGRLRVLMRRDQTLKLCANFSIGPDFQPAYSAGKDNTLVWRCLDFSGVDEQPDGDNMTMLCRMKTGEIAAEFKRAVESGV